MAFLEFGEEQRGVFNQFICSECGSGFVYEDKSSNERMGDLIKINYCPLCGTKIEGILD